MTHGFAVGLKVYCIWKGTLGVQMTQTVMAWWAHKAQHYSLIIMHASCCAMLYIGVICCTIKFLLSLDHIIRLLFIYRVLGLKLYDKVCSMIILRS